jgi:thiamine pyrophosphokinase
VFVKKFNDGYEIIALGLNMSTGDWDSADDDYDRYLRRDGDIDSLTEEEFKAMVSSVRKDLGVPEFE